MNQQNLPDRPIGSDPDDLFEILRGLAVLTQQPLIARLAKTITRYQRQDFAIAFNHRQIGSKLWLCDTLAQQKNLPVKDIWILGGWLGTLAAMLFQRPEICSGKITSFDLDPYCQGVARSLNESEFLAGRFAAVTADMNQLDYQAAPELVINTSCEHLPDVAAWRAKLKPGQRVLLQSNDYFREPDHLSCVADIEAFKQQMRLSEVEFAGSWPARLYTRFMLIGRI